MALLLRERAARFGEWPVEIYGVDINRDVLAKARAARYSAWSLRETSPQIREKYFRGTRSEFVLDKAIAGAVVFEERNLAEPLEEFWQGGRFDVVFCRNVLMYFQPEMAAGIVARIERSLAPGGFLFLGHAETLRGLSNAFHLRWQHETFFYQKREGGAGDGTAWFGLADQKIFPGAASGSGHEVAPSIPTWIEEIDRASARIAHLAESTSKPAAAANQLSAMLNDAAINRVLDLQRQERFAEALTQLQELPSAATADADLQVLRAMLLVNCGRVAEAEALCLPLLGRDELNAGARYIAALCREYVGDLAAAEIHGAAAAYLDPTFAMARFHLGLICKRTGRPVEAQGYFETARALLLKEDPVRLLVFGGGFSRDALMQVCQGEIERTRERG